MLKNDPDKNYEIIFLGDLNDYDKDILDVKNASSEQIVKLASGES